MLFLQSAVLVCAWLPCRLGLTTRVLRCAVVTWLSPCSWGGVSSTHSPSQKVRQSSLTARLSHTAQSSAESAVATNIRTGSCYTDHAKAARPLKRLHTQWHGTPSTSNKNCNGASSEHLLCQSSLWVIASQTAHKRRQAGAGEWLLAHICTACVTS